MSRGTRAGVAGRSRETLIAPEDVGEWTGLHQTLASPAEGWGGVTALGYVTRDPEAAMPRIRDHVIVLHGSGRYRMSLSVEDGPWSHAVLEDGAVSLLTSGQTSHWRWSRAMRATNLTVSPEELARVGEQMFGRELAEVELADTLDAGDPMLTRVAEALRSEAASGGVGGQLLVQSLTCELSVHLLRRHAHVSFVEQRVPGRLTFGQERQVRSFVHENLDRPVSLDELADIVGLSRFHFARLFRRTFGMTAHQFLQQERLGRARALLERGDLPIAQVAVLCGFADQSHLTRLFRQRTGATPAAYRASVRS